MKLLPFIFAIVMMAGCSKKVTTSIASEVFDSTMIEENVRYDTLFVAGDTVRLREWIECDSITNKPVPFKAAGKSGRASVKVVVKKNGDLVVVSTCDSLTKVIAVMDREIFRLRSEKKVVTITNQPSKFKVWFDMTCRGMAAILLVIILYFVFKVVRPFLIGR